MLAFVISCKGLELDLFIPATGIVWLFTSAIVTQACVLFTLWYMFQLLTLPSNTAGPLGSTLLICMFIDRATLPAETALPNLCIVYCAGASGETTGGV